MSTGGNPLNTPLLQYHGTGLRLVTTHGLHFGGSLYMYTIYIHYSVVAGKDVDVYSKTDF